MGAFIRAWPSPLAAAAAATAAEAAASAVAAGGKAGFAAHETSVNAVSIVVAVSIEDLRCSLSAAVAAVIRCSCECC